MAKIKPFCAVRPKKGFENEIAALPYDVYNRKEAKEAVKGKPLSFLNIDRPETKFPDDYDMYANEVYAKASDMFNEMIADGNYVEDNKPMYYIYELTMDGRSQTGIVATASIDDYLNSIIKKHENTRKDKEEDRVRHVDALSAQTGPIFLAYRSNDEIKSVINRVKSSEPDYSFVSEDGIGHRGFIISSDEDIKTISEAFGKINEIYIADGHHRCASAVRVGLMRREENKNYSGEEDFNYFLSVLFQDEELMIMDYNRVIKDLNGLSEDDVISELKKVGELTEITREDKHPENKGNVSVYLSGKWYNLKFNSELINDDPVESLDVSVLQNNVLNPVFGINDPKTDKRIDFVGGIRGIKELEKRVNEDCKIAFAMYPTSISELFNVADANMLMPPKSTWFEPKLRSGLYIHRF